NLHLTGEVIQGLRPAEVIDDKKAAAQEILPHVLHLPLREIHVTNLAQIGDRVFEDLFSLERDNVRARVYVELRHLGHDLHEMLFRPGRIVAPGGAIAGANGSPEIEGRHLVPDAGEGKLVLYHRHLVLSSQAGASPDRKDETKRDDQNSSECA